METDGYGNPICCKCGQAKPHAEFGLTGICYACYRAYLRRDRSAEQQQPKEAA